MTGISLVINARLMEAPTARSKSILSLIHLGTITDALDKKHLLGSHVLASSDSHYGQTLNTFFISEASVSALLFDSAFRSLRYLMYSIS